MSEPSAPLDRPRILAALDRNHVRYVLVGGIASQAHGAQRLTKDIDLCPAWDAENLERLATTLRELGARIVTGEGSIELPPDGKLIHSLEIGNWHTTAGQIDVLLGIPSKSRWELARYDQLATDATVIEIDGQRVSVASLEHIIRSKEIADRPKDREALDELRALRDRQHETGRQSQPPGNGDIG